MAELKFPDFAGEDGATLAGTVITLAGSAVTNHRTFANAASDGNIDFNDGDTLAVDVIDTGGNTATWTATYASGAGTITRTNLEAAQGTLSTSAGAITVYASVPGNWFKEMEPNRLPISATTTVTTSDVTGVAGVQYHLDISGITTASKNFTLPVPAAAGERIKILLTAGDADYELIIKGVATVTINGGSAATEWSRIFITGESVSFVSTSTTNWNVENDNRKPSYGKIDGVGGTSFSCTNDTFETLGGTSDSPAGPFANAVSNDYGMVDTTDGTIKIRRDGDYSINGILKFNSTTGPAWFIAFSVAGDVVIGPKVYMASDQLFPVFFGVASLTVSSDQYIKTKVWQKTGSDFSAIANSQTWFEVKEIL